MCAARDLIPAPPVSGLTVETVTAQADLAAIVENLDLNARGFDPSAPATTEAEAEQFRRGMNGGVAFTARLDGVGVAAGMHLPVTDGTAELAGITTLVPYRGRGIGAALTEAIARHAVHNGAETLFLSTDNPVAQRVYERLGFTPK